MAGGANSIPAYDKIVEHVRSINPKKEVLFLLEDIPENDFSITNATFNAHFKNTSGVFALTAATSFYSQVYPVEHVDLMICLNALHWLEYHPGPLPGLHEASYFIEDKEVRDKWAAAAKRDLANFLNHRVKELRQGGHLLCQIDADQHGESCEFRELMGEISDKILEKRGLGKVAPYVNCNSYWRRLEDI